MTNEKSETSREIVPESPKIYIHTFSEKLLDNDVIHFQIISLDGSFFIWLGKDPVMRNFTVAVNLGTYMKPKDKDPSSTCLIGDSSDPTSVCLAKKLAKRMNKQVFMSYNLPDAPTLLSRVEKRIIDEINKIPDAFGNGLNPI